MALMRFLFSWDRVRRVASRGFGAERGTKITTAGRDWGGSWRQDGRPADAGCRAAPRRRYPAPRSHPNRCGLAEPAVRTGRAQGPLRYDTARGTRDSRDRGSSNAWRVKWPQHPATKRGRNRGTPGTGFSFAHGAQARLMRAIDGRAPNRQRFQGSELASMYISKRSSDPQTGIQKSEYGGSAVSLT